MTREEIHHLAQTDYKYVRMSGRSEENTKIKLVVPIFQAFGYDIIKDMDFEVSTIGGADIVLLKNCKRVAVIETKPLGSNLLGLDAEQALRYGFHLNTEWVFLSNGDETRAFNLWTWDFPLVSFKLRDLEKRYDELSALLHRDHMPEAPALRNLMNEKPKRDPSSRASLENAINANQSLQDLKGLLLGQSVLKTSKERDGYWSCKRMGEKGRFLSLEVRSKGLEVYIFKCAYLEIIDQVTESIRTLPGVNHVSPNSEGGFIKFDIMEERGIRPFFEFCKNRLI
jgi:hypothetical protein